MAAGGDRARDDFEHVSNDDMTTIYKGYVPPNRAKNTKWSVTVFQEWMSARNKEYRQKVSRQYSRVP